MWQQPIEGNEMQPTWPEQEGVGYPLPQGDLPPASDGFGYLDFQRQEWKCPGCHTINSFDVVTCPVCGTSALAILEKYNRPQGKLSKRRAGKRLGLGASVKFAVGAFWLITFIVVAYLVLCLSPILIYVAPAFLVLSILICILHPKKKDKKKAAKELAQHLGEGAIELAALLEEKAGF